MPSNAALPVAKLTLRVLILANWVLGGLLVALLLVSLQQPEWTWRALGAAEIASRSGGATGMRGIIAIGIIGVPVVAAVLAGLLRIVDTVRIGDPFAPANAARLTMIAWALFALQLLQIVVVAIAAAISTDRVPLRLGNGGTLTGWLAVVLLFVLAGVFRVGAGMRADLDGTV